MSDHKYDIGLYGGGWTTGLIALVLAANGRRVLVLRPDVDPEGLPRPFPQLSCQPWQELLRYLPTGADRESWTYAGGRVHDVFSRRVIANADVSETLEPGPGLFSAGVPDTAWAWAEPVRGYREFLSQVWEQVVAAGATVVAAPPGIQLQGGIVRATVVQRVETQPKTWHLVFPGQGMYSAGPRFPEYIPICGTEGSLQWWSDMSQRALWSCGAADETSIRWLPDLKRTAIITRAAAWGVVSARRCRVHTVPPVAATPPDDWAEWIWSVIAQCGGKDARLSLAK